MLQQNSSNNSAGVEYRGEGFFKVFFFAGQPKEIQIKTFDSYNSAYDSFMKCNQTRVLTEGFDIKMSRSISKKNKSELSKLKNFVNTMKQKEEQKNKEFELSLLGNETN